MTKNPQPDIESDAMNCSFCTVINCIDGRVQIPVINYLKERFGVKYVDSVTEAGPNRIVGRASDDVLLDSIIDRVKISLNHHSSVSLAIVAHHDCAANPASKTEQLEDLELGVKYLTGRFSEIPVIGLWVDETWEVSEVFTHAP
jgi:hypothetical protein